jgi:hypothetical protein
MAQPANPTVTEAPIDIPDAGPPPVELPELTVPQDFLDIFPQPVLPVPLFLNAQIPKLMLDRQIGPQLGLSAPACVIGKKASFTMEQIFTTDIPPKKWIEAADKTVTRRLQRASIRSRDKENELTNVCHPTNSNLVFPPWIVKAWKALINIVEMRDDWRRAVSWIENQGESALACTAKERIEQSPWARTVDELSVGTDIIYASVHSRIASRRWLNDSNFEVLIKELNEAVAPPCHAWVSDTRFVSRLRSRWRADPDTAFNGRDLQSRGSSLISDGYKKILLPTNINKDHWIVFKVDLAAEIISWGT